MRIAVISDIHSNMLALRSVLDFIGRSGVDKVYCLGDIVGYGPFPNECVEMVRDGCQTVIAGNHDLGLLGQVPLEFFNRPGQKALRWTRKKITAVNSAYLMSLPLKAEEHDITFVHASPSDPPAWKYVFRNEDVAEAFQAMGTTLCFIGHTHVPALVGEPPGATAGFTRGRRYLINVGSIGQPRDGNPKAAFGILDLERWTYEQVRVEYDVQATMEAMQRFGLPDILSRRLLNGW